MVTDREAVLRERAACEREQDRAKEWIRHWCGSGDAARYIAGCSEPAVLYPLPTVRRLRRIPAQSDIGPLTSWYRYNPHGPAYEVRLGSRYAPWGRVYQVPANLVDALADLKANPYEDVSDE